VRRNRRCGHQAVHDDSRMAKNKCDGPKDSDIQKLSPWNDLFSLSCLRWLSLMHSDTDQTISVYTLVGEGVVEE
jgi:hypothetical protein